MLESAAEASSEVLVDVFEELDGSTACYFMLLNLQRQLPRLVSFAIVVPIECITAVDLAQYYYLVNAATVT